MVIHTITWYKRLLMNEWKTFVITWGWRLVLPKKKKKFLRTCEWTQKCSIWTQFFHTLHWNYTHKSWSVWSAGPCIQATTNVRTVIMLPITETVILLFSWPLVTGNLSGPYQIKRKKKSQLNTQLIKETHQILSYCVPAFKGKNYIDLALHVMNLIG